MLRSLQGGHICELFVSPRSAELRSLDVMGSWGVGFVVIEQYPSIFYI